jgi:N-formylglutamate amidohydrolase
MGALSRRALVRGLMGSGVVAAARGAVAAPDDFVVAQAGTVPLILTAPHGGTAMAGLPERRRGTKLRDEHTLEVALAVASHLMALGVTPYLVAARFSRKAIDANRAPEEAFDDDAARPLYRAYHGRIEGFVAEARARFPGGALLVDIHGQATDPNAVFRGTRNGATVRRLLAHHGVAALCGPDSILGALQANGRTIVPANTPPGEPSEHASYRGGFTVATYSREPDGIDALQIELGLTLRASPRFGDELADAMARFTRAFLVAG